MITPGLGGLQPPPMNAPAAGALVPGVQPGVSGGVVLARYVIVFGTAGGVFVYNGTPALGNPPIFWATAASTDPYGNTVTPTAGVAASGQFWAGDTVITATGIYTYSGTPTSGNLIGSTAPTGADDPFGNTVLPGTVSYSSNFAAQMYGGVLQLYTSILTTQFPATVLANSSYAGELDLESGAAGNGDFESAISLFSQLNSDPLRQYTNQSEVDVYTQQMYVDGSFSLLSGNGPFVLGESWHTLSNASSWSGTMRVKLVPWIGTWIDVEVSYSGTASGTFTFGSMPSSTYYPTTDRQLPLAVTTGLVTATDAPCRLFVPASSGGIQIVIGSTLEASGASFSTSTIFPIN